MPPIQPVKKGSLQSRCQIFRFSSLPLEIRNIIYQYVFETPDTEKTRRALLRALSIKPMLYQEALAVYCQITTIIVPLIQNAPLSDLDMEEVKLIRRIDTTIPHISPLTKLSPVILSLTSTLQHLTLHTIHAHNLSIMTMRCLPLCTSLLSLTVTFSADGRSGVVGCEDSRLSSHSDAVHLIDKMLGVKGVSYRSRGERKRWKWVSPNNHPFDIKSPTKHIKFSS